MPAPKSPDELVALLRRSALLEPARLDGYLTSQAGPFDSPAALAARMQADGLLTPFHVEQLMKGKHRGYYLGKYRLIDRIGLGGMGQVFLCEHVSMRRRAALKVLPPDRTDNPYSRERFLREARAAGQLDHPNLVRAFDVDQEGEVYFLVMEYVDGVSFHDLVTRFGPLTPPRAGYYLWQAALGLAYLHSCGLVHRDIKPANLLVDRQGVVKILDLGLVRGENLADDLTRKEGVRILGTADYLAPEQAIDCSTVDVRADVYGLGATAYFLLTGHPPFPAEKMAQKLIAHQVKTARPVHEVRPDVPVEFSAVVARMLAKKPADRYQTPEELLDALTPWAQDPPPPPTEQEIPTLAGGVYGCPGTVSLGGPRSARGSGVGSGSAIRYHSDTPGGARPTLLTPVPRPMPRLTPSPKPTPSLLDTPLPPVLPAAATHGYSRVTAPVPAVVEAEPATLVPAPQPADQNRRRLLTGLAFALTLAVGVWDAVVLSRASARPTAPPAQQRHDPAAGQPGDQPPAGSEL